MSETLTQKEVDQLLQGNAPLTRAGAPDVVPYNFIRPPRVSKDRRATLEAIYNRLALAVQAYLSSRLRTPMDVVVTSVEQAMLSEFILSIPRPSAAFVFKAGDRIGGHGVLDFNTELAFHLLDRMFGGPGDSVLPERSLTSLEQTVIRGVAERVVGLLRDAWQDQLPMQPEIVSFESNPDMLQVASREDNVLVAILEVRSGVFSGAMTIGLPVTIFEPFLQDPAVRQKRSTTGRDASTSRGLIESNLQHSRLVLSVRLPAIRIAARAVASLEAGQVIDVAQPIDAPVEVHINGRLRYLGAIGQVRRRLGLRIVQSVTTPAPQRPGTIREGRLL